MTRARRLSKRIVAEKEHSCPSGSEVRDRAWSMLYETDYFGTMDATVLALGAERAAAEAEHVQEMQRKQHVDLRVLTEAVREEVGGARLRRSSEGRVRTGPAGEAALHSEVGKRDWNEDRVYVVGDMVELLGLHGNTDPAAEALLKGALYAGVFDGHCGSDAAETASTLFHHILARSASGASSTELLLRDTFAAMNAHLRDRALNITEGDSGSTATVLLADKSRGFVANVGDSKAVLVSKGGVTKALTANHHISNPPEAVSAMQRGGEILEVMGTPMLNGRSQLTRCLGNTDLEGVLLRTPSIASFDITEESDYIILASDGLWDVFSPEEAAAVVEEVRAELVAEECTYSNASMDSEYIESLTCGTALIAEALTSEAIERGSTDNVSVAVVFF